LKRLAAQIETGQKPPSAPLEPSPAVAWARENFENDGRNLETIDDAVDALQSAVGSMRASLEGAAQQPTAAPVARDPARERLEAIADAIATERMDVMLEPILGLKQHRAQHFSVSVRLRTLNGDVLEPANVIAAAGGTGLLSMFDALRVKRASGVAARLDSNGRPGSVFSGVSGEGVIGDALLRDVERGRAQGEVLPERLVLTFSQEDVRLFTPGQWRTITSLRDLGFRFALENVTHLGMDFEGLVAIGFTFVKLDASVFLQGLPHGAGMLPASDVCRHFAGLGMAVVVTGIEEETVHARVMGFGALLGQGSLFGAPRPVKSGPPRGTTAAYA
jgi:cyclic-di-GMP phosphodiesterase TipF (flagellum assembly factor)